MGIRVLTLAIVVTLLVWPAGAAQQSEESLAETAAKEKERRKAKKPAKTFTEEDLRRAGGGRANIVEGSEAETAAAPAAEAKADASGAPAEKTKTDAEIRAEKQADYQKRIDTEKKVIAAVRAEMEKAQRELNDLANYTFGPRRQALMKIIEDGPKEIAKAEQTIAGIADEARRQGITVSQ